MPYILNADQVPAPVIPTGYIDPSDGTPTTLSSLVNGMAAVDAVPIWQEWAAAIDAQGRFGGGARAVNSGLGLSDSGTTLTVRVAAGQASIDGPVTLGSYVDVPVSDNIYNAGDAEVRIHLWLTQGGTVTPVNNSLTAPSTNCAYLGSCRTDSGAFVDFDSSGVLVKLQGGILYRRTADAGAPTDTPSSSVMFFHQTAGGWYLWTGSAYLAILDSQTVKTDGTHSTSGTLADVTTAGAGIALAVVDTGGGVWKLQISFDAETATGIVDQYVGACAADNTPGLLEDKLQTNDDFDLSPDAASPGDRHLLLSYTPHVETLPAFDVVVEPGETKYVVVDFGDRGSFPLFTEGVDYGVTVALDTYDDGGEADAGPEKVAAISEVLYLTEGGSTGARKDGNHCILRIENRQIPGGQMRNTFTIIVTLRGPNWTAGASPSADPTITEFDLHEDHVETFTVTASCPPGEARVLKIDFSEIGLFGSDFLAKVAVDQDPTKTLVSRLVGFTEGEQRLDGDLGYEGMIPADTLFHPTYGILYLLVQNATDAAAGDYYTSTALQLTIRLEGKRWKPNTGGTGEAVVTATEFVVGEGPVTPPSRIAPLCVWEDIEPDARPGSPTTVPRPQSASTGASPVFEWLAPGPGSGRRLSLLSATGPICAAASTYTAEVYINSVATGEALAIATADGRAKSGTVDVPFVAGDLVEIYVSATGTISPDHILIELSGYVEDY